jgi:tetraacyldisaccharide-1-P 4'-kinase
MRINKESKLTPKSFINLSTGVVQPLDFFEKTVCHAVAGIGHPQRFFDTLMITEKSISLFFLLLQPITPGYRQ